ncbi:MAG: response regulator [Candidatus Saccharimonadales bacterium]
MAKIMLVEDDNNLREIYEARLIAEGYEIVSAKDGEEALALAVKEKPDLIISDVMMPKISGFDMLDILRTTPETKNTKIIMMTALSQAEDKTRAAKLGADRYLVKSQVTLEDVATVAREVLTGEIAPSATPAPTEPVVATPPAPEPTQVTEPVATPATPSATPAPTEPVVATPPAPEPTQATDSIDLPTAPMPDANQASTTTTNETSNQDDNDDVSPHLNKDTPSAPKKVINPINNIDEKPDLNDLLEKEQRAAESPVNSFETVDVSNTPKENPALSPQAPAAETPVISQHVNAINISDDGTIVTNSPTTEIPAPVAEIQPTTPVITPVATPPPLQGEESKEPAPTNIPQPPSEDEPTDPDPNSPNNIAL